jgi:hypothetical protein
VALALVVLLAGTTAAAEGVSVEGGAIFSLGTGTLDLGCGDLAVAGTFQGGSGLLEARDVSIQATGFIDAGSATFRVTGDWTQGGDFEPGTSGVEFLDGCGRTSSTLTGNTAFFDLSLITSEGKLYQLEAGETQKVDGLLTLAGEPGQRLVLRSTVDGVAGTFEVQGTQSVSYVDVKDNQVIANPIFYGPDSIARENTDGWIFLGIPVPALGALGRALLVALLLLGAAVVQRRSRSARDFFSSAFERTRGAGGQSRFSRRAAVAFAGASVLAWPRVADAQIWGESRWGEFLWGTPVAEVPALSVPALLLLWGILIATGIRVARGRSRRGSAGSRRETR